MWTKQNSNLQVGHEGLSTSHCDIPFIYTQWSCKGTVMATRKHFACIHSVRELMNCAVISWTVVTIVSWQVAPLFCLTGCKCCDFVRRFVIINLRSKLVFANTTCLIWCNHWTFWISMCVVFKVGYPCV